MAAQADRPRGIDTRALTRLSGSGGAPNGVIAHSPAASSNSGAAQRWRADWPGLEGMDLAKESAATAEARGWRRRDAGRSGEGYGEHARRARARPHVVAIDYGAKDNIFRNLVKAGARVTVVPATATLRGDPGAQARRRVPLERPRRPRGDRRICRAGDPALLEAASRCSASASATSCSALAVGAKTSKMLQGHRGANHPVKRLATARSRSPA